eukprot:SAG22_NODE_4250_length_1327_cov_1.730456_2_plen_365_part_01
MPLIQFPRDAFDETTGAKERKTLVYGPPGSVPTQGTPAPDLYEPAACFEFLDTEYRRGTPCASAFKSEARQRIAYPAPGGYVEAKSQGFPGPGQYDSRVVRTAGGGRVDETWPEPQVGRAAAGINKDGSTGERTQPAFRIPAEKSRVSRKVRYGDEDGQGPGRYWTKEYEALHETGAQLKWIATSVKGTSGVAASGRQRGHTQFHVPGSAQNSWVNRQALKTPGIQRSDNSAADVAVKGDRKHWRQMNGVTVQAVSSKALPFYCASTVFLSKTAPFLAVPLGQVERFDEYWDAVNERPAVKYRSKSALGGASGGWAPSFEAVEKKAVSGSFAALMEKLQVPKHGRAQFAKSMSDGQKKAMLRQHE